MEVMRASAILQLANSAELTDEEVVTRVLNGETALFEILMRRYNQRLYRIARAILQEITQKKLVNDVSAVAALKKSVEQHRAWLWFAEPALQAIVMRHGNPEAETAGPTE